MLDLATAVRVRDDRRPWQRIDVNLHPLNRPRERVPARAVVRRYRLTDVAADLHRFVHREEERVRAFDPSAASQFAIAVERRGAALAETATVICELHPHLVRAGRQLLGRRHVELLEAEEVVVVSEPAPMRVEAPAAKIAAMRRDNTRGAAVRHIDIRGDRV